MTALLQRLPASAHPWAYGIEFEYDAEMVDAIKRHIPSRHALRWLHPRRWAAYRHGGHSPSNRLRCAASVAIGTARGGHRGLSCAY